MPVSRFVFLMILVLAAAGLTVAAAVWVAPRADWIDGAAALSGLLLLALVLRLSLGRRRNG